MQRFCQVVSTELRKMRQRDTEGGWTDTMCAAGVGLWGGAAWLLLHVFIWRVSSNSGLVQRVKMVRLLEEDVEFKIGEKEEEGQGGVGSRTVGCLVKAEVGRNWEWRGQGPGQGMR